MANSYGFVERRVLPFARGRMLLKNLATCAVFGLPVQFVGVSFELTSRRSLAFRPVVIAANQLEQRRNVVAVIQVVYFGSES